MSGFTFALDRPQPEHPALSVICINKDHDAYLEETILSVFSQNFDNFEFFISDGGSTDRSLEIIAQHQFIKLLTGDKSREEGLMNALKAARGRYVMITTSTDGYLSRDWFRKATETLDQNPNVSMIYGACAKMSAESSLGGISFPNASPFESAPQLEKLAETWLFKSIHGAYLPELNYCVRTDIARALYGNSAEFPELNGIDPVLRFHFEFNRLGYLALYFPILANFGRTHANQSQFTEKNMASVRVYDSLWARYRDDVLADRRHHQFRNGAGQVIATVSLAPPSGSS